MNGRISDELCASKSGIVVQYLDDEDDWITVQGLYTVYAKLYHACQSSL